MLPERENVTVPESASLRYCRFTMPRFEYLWHFHPEVELVLVLASQGHRFVGDSIELYQPGDLVLLGSNLPHTWHGFVPHIDAPNPEAEAVVVQFRTDAEPWLSLPEAKSIQHLLHRARLGLKFPPGYRGVDRRLIDMEHLTGWPRLLALLDILGRLAEDPTAGTALSGPAHALPPRLDDQRRIDRVCRRLAESYAQPITQSEAAAAEHMSPSAFSRFFKRMTDRTFVGYLHELRIADACRRLSDPETPVTEIAFACGFANLSNFNRVFRRLRGTSPREYRRRLAIDPLVD